MILFKTGTINVSDGVITEITDTSKIKAGMFVYGDGIDVRSKVSSIDSSTQVTMDKIGLKTGAKSLEFTFADVGVVLERNCALNDTKEIVDERGDQIIIRNRNDVNIVRSRYNSVKRRSRGAETSAPVDITINAFPIDFSPNRRSVERAGLREEADAIVWTAMRDWINNSLCLSLLEVEKCQCHSC